MSGPYDAVDNSASFMGRYSLTNPTTAWLIQRGFGELVALTPSEMQQSETLPKCPGVRSHQHGKTGAWIDNKHGPRCDAPMRYRPDGFVCYEHATPVRVRRSRSAIMTDR